VSVEFDPVRVRRRRRLDPLVLGVGVAVVAVIVAVAKPWEASDGGANADRATASPTSTSPVAAVPSTGPRRTPRPTQPPVVTDGLPMPAWEDIRGVVGSHRAMGVLALTGHVSRFTRSGVDVGLAASWASVETAAGGVGPNPDVRSGDASVLGLGVTFPAGEAPLDLRVWLERAVGGLEWVDVVPVPRPAADDPIMLMRLTESGAVEPFEAGHYRLDLLRKDAIVRVEVGIADSTGTIPDPAPWPLTESRLVPATESDPSAVRFGLFATVDRFAVSLPVAESRPLDELDAWDATRADPPAGTTPAVVAAFLPRATGLGVMLTPHAAVELSVLSRLAPAPLVPVPPARGGLSEAQGRTPYIVFAGPEGRPLEAGVYALSVSWTDAGGLHAGTWHVELRPGPVHD
jgi:hypothetical protein